MYKVIIKKKVNKSIEKMPKDIRLTMALLVTDLEKSGPIQKAWANFSKLGNNKYHCHLSYKWVACWEYIENNITIEVYYAGSRENAPY
jgi:mRNA-degrading endonuclease RelE of RelBE toxin-antitoxin system